jgi:hypothetical protein
MKTASILTVLALLLAAVPVSAQFTLTQGSFPATGGHTVGDVLSTATFNVGQAGTNRTWTFDGYEWERVTHEELVDAASSPFYANYPTANRCVLSTGDAYPVYVYFRMAANGLYFLGTASIDTVLAPASEARVVVFPCTYQTNWTTVMRYEWEPIPGYVFSQTDSSVNTVDGWGTLITPYGSNSVLRAFSHDWMITQIPILPPDITENVSYTWFSSQGEQLLVVTSEDDVTVPNFSSGTLTMTGLPEAVEPVRGPVAQNFTVGQNYPNPFNPVTALPIELEKTAHVTLTIYDETGRMVSHGEFELTAGHHELPVSGSDWAAGTYFARVMAGAEGQTVKMQLVK